MSQWLERCLAGYFQLMGLVCGWSGSRLGRLLGSSFLVLIMIELAGQVRSYIRGDFWDTSDFGSKFFFAKAIQGVSVGYKVVHVMIALLALLEGQRSRRLLEQLPPIKTTPSMYRQLVLEVLMNAYVIGLSLHLSNNNQGEFFENLRIVYSNQAVRARYLQMLVLVERLDFQLEQLLHRMAAGPVDYQARRSEYAHLAQVARSLSQLYGLSLLLLNVLCLGDCLMVCNVYFMMKYLEDLSTRWFIITQAVYIVMPTLVKIWTLCAACHRCAARSKYVQRQLKDRPGQPPTERCQIEEFVLQVMQDPIRIDICGIYHLNLQTLAGMFFFILEALVIFLQFVSLVGPRQAMD